MKNLSLISENTRTQQQLRDQKILQFWSVAQPNPKSQPSPLLFKSMINLSLISNLQITFKLQSLPFIFNVNIGFDPMKTHISISSLFSVKTIWSESYPKTTHCGAIVGGLLGGCQWCWIILSKIQTGLAGNVILTPLFADYNLHSPKTLRFSSLMFFTSSSRTHAVQTACVTPSFTVYSICSTLSCPFPLSLFPLYSFHFL